MPSPTRLFLLFTLALLPIANALHFYLDAAENKCFLEELPVDTIVEGPSQVIFSPWRRALSSPPSPNSTHPLFLPFINLQATTAHLSGVMTPKVSIILGHVSRRPRLVICLIAYLTLAVAQIYDRHAHHVSYAFNLTRLWNYARLCY